MNSGIGRIVIIEGLWCYDNLLALAFERGFKRQFPNARVIPESIRGCWPNQIMRLIEFVDRLAQKYDDGVPTLLVGHSMGGIIACALEGRFLHSPLIGIVTICSPHQYFYGYFPYMLGACHKLSAPIITFSAYRDVLVPWGTSHPQSREHLTLECDHRYGMILEERHVQRIARASNAHFG